MPLPCATLCRPGSHSREPGNSPAGLENATSPGPPPPPVSLAAGTGAREGGTGSRVPGTGPTWVPRGRRGCRSGAAGPPVPRPPGAGPACVGTWLPPRPRPQRRPGSPGDGWVGKPGSGSLQGPSVASAATVEVCRRPGPGPRRLSGPHGPSSPAGHPGPSSPARSTRPGPEGRAQKHSAWWHCGSTNVAAQESPASPSALCGSKNGPAKPQKPVPPPEWGWLHWGAGRAGRAAFGLPVGSDSVPPRTWQAPQAPGDPSPHVSGSPRPPL